MGLFRKSVAAGLPLGGEVAAGLPLGGETHPPAVGTRKPGTHLRRSLVGLLGFGLLFEVSLLAGVVAGPLLQGWLPGMGWKGAGEGQDSAPDPTALLVRWRQSVYDRAADPKVGMPAPALALRSFRGERLRLAELRGQRVVLVFARDASSCSTEALVSTWSRLAQEIGNTRVLIAVPPLEEAEPVCEAVKDGTTVWLDPARRAARAYNARWLPRAYALDEQGALAYAQPETTLDPQAPLEVGRAFRRSGVQAFGH